MSGQVIAARILATLASESVPFDVIRRPSPPSATARSRTIALPKKADPASSASPSSDETRSAALSGGTPPLSSRMLPASSSGHTDSTPPGQSDNSRFNIAASARRRRRRCAGPSTRLSPESPLASCA